MITQYKITQREADRPVQLEQLKEFLQINYTEEDALLTDILARAYSAYQSVTGRVLVESDVLLTIVGPFNRYLPTNDIQRNTIEATNATMTDIIARVDSGQIATITYVAGGFSEADAAAVIEIAATMYQSKMTSDSMVNGFVAKTYRTRIIKSLF
jgi:hypothetical protein